MRGILATFVGYQEELYNASIDIESSSCHFLKIQISLDLKKQFNVINLLNYCILSHSISSIINFFPFPLVIKRSHNIIYQQKQQQQHGVKEYENHQKSQVMKVKK